MKIEEITAFDSVDYLKTNEDLTAYLEAALEIGEPALIAVALGNIARARGMTDVARATGLSRESLYKSFSGQRTPSLATVLKVSKALGLRWEVRAS